MSEPIEAEAQTTPTERPPVTTASAAPAPSSMAPTRLIGVGLVATERSYKVRDIDANHVQGLAASIGDTGLLQPIVVRQTGDRYELVAGAHRLAAMKELGVEQVEAVVLNEVSDAIAEAAAVDLALGKLQAVTSIAEPGKPELQLKRQSGFQIVDVLPHKTEADAERRAPLEEL